MHKTPFACRAVSNDSSCSGTMEYEQTSMLHAQTTMVHEQKPMIQKHVDVIQEQKNMSWNMLKWTGHMNKGNIIPEYIFFRPAVYGNNARGGNMAHVRQSWYMKNYQ